jgi:hypothetical protein
MDACKATNLPPDVQGTRLPAWLLPAVSDELRNKLRPDIVVIAGLTQQMVNTCSNVHDLLVSGTIPNLVIHVIEVGYGRDTDLATTEGRKTEQHRQLMDFLRHEYRSQVRLHIIAIGRTGSIPRSLATHLDQLGISPAQADKLSRKLHRHAVAYVDKLYTQRRALEAEIVKAKRSAASQQHNKRPRIEQPGQQPLGIGPPPKRQQKPAPPFYNPPRKRAACHDGRGPDNG